MLNVRVSKCFNLRYNHFEHSLISERSAWIYSEQMLHQEKSQKKERVSTNIGNRSEHWNCERVWILWHVPGNSHHPMSYIEHYYYLLKIKKIANKSMHFLMLVFERKMIIFSREKRNQIYGVAPGGVIMAYSPKGKN